MQWDRFALGAALAASTLFAAAPAAAQARVRPSAVDGFRLGTGGEALCRVELAVNDPVAAGTFDRAYTVACRDAATPIGRLYAVRAPRDRVLAALAQARALPVRCTDTAQLQVADVGTVRRDACVRGDGAAYLVFSGGTGRTTYVAEGLAGYRSALELGLRTLAADRIVDGPIVIATTELGDAAAFARAQAGSLDPTRALAEGYRRNNTGDFAEAAEFFDVLSANVGSEPEATRRPGEYLVNQALQQSNLGDDERADALFAQALALPSNDPVELRLRRNFLAIHRLNQRDYAAALSELDRPVTPALPPAGGAEIDAATARRLNDSVPLARRIGLVDSEQLTTAERAAILDGQALALRGAALRRLNRPAEATTALDAALARLAAIRSGRVASAAHVRAQILTEQSALAEAAGDRATAEARLRAAQALMEVQYPGSRATTLASARLANFLARTGRIDDALALFRQVIVQLGTGRGATIGIEPLLDPYFALLVSRPDKIDDLFLASQTLVRPSVADTQAILARELQGGSDEAARLFRQSLNLTREAQALRVEIARLSALAKPSEQDRAGIARDRAQLVDAENAQAATQSRLNDFSNYRAISTEPLTLASLREVLRPDEGYWKLAAVGRSLYGLYVTRDTARAWKVPLSVPQLEAKVNALRDTVAKVEASSLVTYPFDVVGARALFVALAGPAADAIAAQPHLIFEPDGAMERLPAALLVTDEASVAKYRARLAVADADPFDVRGVGWLGRRAALATAVSARAFRDVRNTPRSAAGRAYLGFGQNAPVPVVRQLTATTPSDGVIDCRWPLASWSNPIAATELYAARDMLGRGRGTIETGSAFTDEAVKARRDLDQYRVLHFATHGLVAGPLPQCAARPALITSFGGEGSDGLLGFREIYDLKLDADLVILSACDTAGEASVAATREAGLTGGGGAALDGLVRAFVGAGGRAVIASHWPAPDDYAATRNLVTGLFAAPAGTGVGDALAGAQRRLMDTRETSHPFYWAGFVLIGDGSKPVQPAP